MRSITLIACTFTLISWGQFDGPGGEPGSRSIHFEDQAITAWASTIDITRGWMDVADTALGVASAGTEENALGVFDGAAVSLGDGGVAVLSFAEAITDREGYDFAVFENGFKVGLSYFLELAYVEVSKDGINYVRFPNESLTDTSVQINSFGYIDPFDIYNLAGKHQAPYGTLFDLSEVDLDTVNYIRIVDVIGTVNDSFCSRDSKGRIVNDPYPTDFESGGFDLDAVARVEGYMLSARTLTAGSLRVYPSIVQQGQLIRVDVPQRTNIEVYDQLGRRIMHSTANEIRIQQKGSFYIRVILDYTILNSRICVY